MISIGGREIGEGRPPFVVAEMSGNHGGDLSRALAIVDAVAAAGAHAVKLQTYRADTITVDCERPAFRVGDDHELWGGRTLYRLYDEAHTPWDWHRPIFDRAAGHGLVAFSSPFDPTAVELLESLGTPAYKIASSEIVDLPLIRLAAGTGKPLVISTGMATVGEIHAAVAAARDAGCTELALLACTAAYPAAPEQSDLRSLPVLRTLMDSTLAESDLVSPGGTAGARGVVGLSDHTPGIGVAVAAVALGARVVEKHVTLSRGDGGVDAAFSLEPGELAGLVTEAERAWQALGRGHVGPRPGEREGLRFRRSLHVVRDVRAGDPVSEANVRSIRPAGGLPPDALRDLMGRRFTRDAAVGTPLTWDLV